MSSPQFFAENADFSSLDTFGAGGNAGFFNKDSQVILFLYCIILCADYNNKATSTPDAEYYSQNSNLMKGGAVSTVDAQVRYPMEASLQAPHVMSQSTLNGHEGDEHTGGEGRSDDGSSDDSLGEYIDRGEDDIQSSDGEGFIPEGTYIFF